jgi:hypothetical protein
MLHFQGKHLCPFSSLPFSSATEVRLGSPSSAVRDIYAAKLISRNVKWNLEL